jgi:hypothetical protein
VEQLGAVQVLQVQTLLRAVPVLQVLPALLRRALAL